MKLGVLGAGNYAGAVFLPSIKKVGGVQAQSIVSASGLTARQAAQKFGFLYAGSSEEEVLADPDINVIALLTRHQHHARQVMTALKNGKAVYCEKPLAIKNEELQEIQVLLQDQQLPLLTVGFNRRFAPLSIPLANFFKNRSEPLVAHYRINAGFLPLNHWTQDPEQGGGRIIGEGCHFIDYLTFLVGSVPLTVQAVKLPDMGKYHNDNVVLTLTYPDGSIGSIHYLANGDKSVPKEYLEVFCGGKVAVLKDFRSLELTANGQRTVHQLRFSQDKGHKNAWSAFVNALQNNGTPPIPYEQLFGVTAASFAAEESLATQETIKIKA